MPDKKCEELIKQEKYKELLAYCDERISTKPAETHVFYKGVAYTMLKDFSKAENIFTALFNKTEKYFYLICRGLVKFLGEKFEEGKEDLKEAIENDESYNDMFFVFRIASNYYDLEDAREALEKAMEIDRKKSLEDLGGLFEALSETASNEDRLLFVRLMELLKTL